MYEACIYVLSLGVSAHGFRYFSLNRTGSEVTQQSGVFRVNCMDCLDRTNVVEGLLAKRSLKQQLIKLGVLNDEDRIESQSTFDYVFRNGLCIILKLLVLQAHLFIPFVSHTLSLTACQSHPCDIIFYVLDCSMGGQC